MVRSIPFQSEQILLEAQAADTLTGTQLIRGMPE